MRDREMLLREARELASSKPTQDAMKAFVAELEPEEKQLVIEEFHRVIGMMSDDMVFLMQGIREALTRFFNNIAPLVERTQKLGILTEQDRLKGDDDVHTHSAG